MTAVPAADEARTQGRTDLRICRRLLPDVSRTFALTIGVLPRPLRDPVTAAYLLCRIADTVEDATGIDPPARMAGLDRFSAALEGAEPVSAPIAPPGPSAGPLDDFLGLIRTWGGEDRALGIPTVLDGPPIRDSASLGLLRQAPLVFRVFRQLPQAQREVISHWIRSMCAGMSLHVSREIRAQAEGSGRVRAVEVAGAPARALYPGGIHETGAILDHAVPFRLETIGELRTYAWYVAGTVGRMLTDLFELHLGGGSAPWDRLRELGASFGLGLQFTNVLQDLSEDRRRGWSYVPEELARRHGTSVRDLIEPAERGAALKVVADLITETAAYLDQAMEYTLLLPRRAPRVRLFCLWPTFFALRTLVRIWGEEGVLTGGDKVRITRAEVRRVMRSTALSCLWNGRLERLYDRERARLVRRMAVCPV